MRTHMMQYRILSQSQAIGENSLRSQTTSLHLSLKYLDSILPNVGLVERTWKNSNNEQRRKDDKNAKIASFGDDANDYNVRCHEPHNMFVKMKIKCFSKRKLNVRISKTKIKCAILGFSQNCCILGKSREKLVKFSKNSAKIQQILANFATFCKNQQKKFSNF